MCVVVFFLIFFIEMRFFYSISMNLWFESKQQQAADIETYLCVLLLHQHYINLYNNIIAVFIKVSPIFINIHYVLLFCFFSLKQYIATAVCVCYNSTVLWTCL